MSTLKKNSTQLILIFLLVAGCTAKPAEPTITPVPPTPTSLPPTPTSLPMAIQVNGEGILQSDYEEEYKRFEAAAAALGKTFTPEEIKSRIVEDLTGTLLLDLEAKKNGFQLSNSDLDVRIAQVTKDQGGDAAFKAWLQANLYSPESFRRSLMLSLGAAWQRDKILSAMPATAEQVHARQIVFNLEASAINYRQKVDGGTNFADLAAEADPVTKGDLGWFPRGYLLQPEVEDAAFSLQPGEVSQVIKSAIGYHLVQVIEKDPAKELSPDAKKALQNKALKTWIEQARTQAKIEVLIP
jgi:peptidyl-prolyl cis-trans isomerase C